MRCQIANADFVVILEKLTGQNGPGTQARERNLNATAGGEKARRIGR